MTEKELGFWEECELAMDENKPEYVKRATKCLIDSFGIPLSLSDRMLLLREINNAIEIQRNVYKNAGDGKCGAGLISVPDEAVMNYLERWHGFSCALEQHSTYLHINGFINIRNNPGHLRKIRRYQN